MAQPREAADDLSEHQWRTIAVLDISGVDHRVDQIAVGIGQDVALAPLGPRCSPEVRRFPWF
jgi:hypothetical protein